MWWLHGYRVRVKILMGYSRIGVISRVTMKRHTIKYLDFMLVVLLLVGVCGCEKISEGAVDSGNDNVVDDIEYVVKFDCDVTDDSKLNSDGFEVGDQIGLFSYPSKSSIHGESEFVRLNVPYIHHTNKLSLVDGLNLEPIYFSEDVDLTLDFVGYYPYSDKMTVSGFLSLGDLSDQSENVFESILYSNNAINKSRTANSIKLSFGYVMAQVIVNIKYDLESVPDGDVVNITDVILEGNNLHTKCDFYVATGDISGKDGVDRSAIIMKAGVATTVANVSPNAVNDIVLRIVTKEYTYVAKPRDIHYERGKQHEYNVTLRGEPVYPGDKIVEVEIIESPIVDWKPGNDGVNINPGAPS